MKKVYIGTITPINEDSWLFNRDDFFKNDAFNMKISNNIFVRLYPDSRPHVLEIADLQKGLLLVVDGMELVGEGTGFGVPIVKYEDSTYFSQDATIFLTKDSDSISIVKSFEISSISKKRLGKGVFLNDGFYNFLHKYFERVYLSWKNFRHAFDKIMELRKLLKINTQFVEGENKGQIDVHYKFFTSLIKIDIDFGKLSREGIKEILILNEQDSTFFRYYFDTDGCQLLDNQIGAWEKVKAKRASFSDLKKKIVFTLQNVNGAQLYRGREQVKKRFSWSGFTYSLPHNVSQFNYSIFLEG